jgi:hypothetical protein
MREWSVESNTGDALVPMGPVVAAAAGRFTLRFDHERKPFSMQWAEVVCDGAVNAIRGSGTLRYGGSAWTGGDLITRATGVPNQFTRSVVVPLQGAALLFLSALLSMPLRGLLRQAAT